MAVLNIQDVNLYPDNYDFLPADKQEKIIGYMNGIQDLADRFYKQHQEVLLDDNPDNDADHDKYLRMYNHQITSLTGSKNAYATLGIMVEYNWRGHYHRWALVTKEDAILYNEKGGAEAPKDDEVVNPLLSFPEVG